MKKENLKSLQHDLRQLGFFQNGLNIKIKLRIFSTFVTPKLEFGVGIFEPSNKYCEEFTKLHHNSLKIAFGVSSPCFNLLFAATNGRLPSERFHYLYYRRQQNYNYLINCETPYRFIEKPKIISKVTSQLNENPQLLHHLLPPHKNIEQCPFCHEPNQHHPHLQ